MDNSPKLGHFDNYLLSLGRFVHTFSEVEQILQVALHVLAGTKREVASAIFSGVKSDTARSFIKRLHESKSIEIPPELSRALDQIGVITTVRNDIVHLGASYIDVDGFGLVSNESNALPGRERKTPISADILSDLCADLETAKCGIIYGALIENRLDEVSAVFITRTRDAANAPWRYKPHSQDNTRQKRRAQSLKRGAPL